MSMRGSGSAEIDDGKLSFPILKRNECNGPYTIPKKVTFFWYGVWIAPMNK